MVNRVSGHKDGVRVSVRERLRFNAHVLLLSAWRRLPFPRWLRWRIVEAFSPRYVVGAHAIIRDETGRLLLLHHPYRGRTPWGTPGGGLKRSEDPAVAVVRETFEETGLHVRPRRLLLVNKSSGAAHLALLYECDIVGGNLRFGPEISAADFFAPDALPQGINAIERAAIARALDTLDDLSPAIHPPS